MIFSEYPELSIPENFAIFQNKLIYLPSAESDDVNSRSLNIFYSHMCPHCESMYEEIKKIDNFLKMAGIKIHVVPLPSDGSKGFDLLQRYFNIAGVPTIFYQRGPFMMEFNGENADSAGSDAVKIMEFIYNSEIDDERRRKIKEFIEQL